jgi:hypothetical protein
MIPAPWNELPVIGFTRSPWSYYVSWYAFQKRRAQPNPLFRILSEDGQLDFAGTVRNMLELGSGGDKLESLLGALPPTYTHRGLNLPAPALAPIRDSGLGFFGFLYQHIYGGEPGRRYIGRMELLRESLLLMFDSVGQPVTQAMREFVLRQPARNVSEHSAYTSYYTEELRDLVALRDRDVIAAHGYRFGD